MPAWGGRWSRPWPGNPSPPPLRTDPPAADRTAPGAHDRPATGVYQGGVRWRGRGTGPGARGRPPGQRRREQRRGPPFPSFPHSLPACGPRGRRPSTPPRGRGGVPPPPEWTVTPGRQTQLDLHAARPRTPTCPPPRGSRQAGKPAPARKNSARPTPGCGARQRTGAVWGPRPHGPRDADDARSVARPGRAEGRTEAKRPPGPPAPWPPHRRGGSRTAPPPLPPPDWPAGGRPHPAPGAAPRPRPKAYTGKGGYERGAKQRAAGRPPQRARRGATARSPPIPPPPRPTRKPRGCRPPPPPEAGEVVPPPPGRTAAPGREAGAGPAATPLPPTQTGTTTGIRTCANTRTAPENSKRAQTGTVWGPRPPWPERRPEHPLCCLPREGRGTDRGKATPSPTGPPAAQTGGMAHRPPPTPPHPPARERPRRARPTPRGGHSPQPGRGEMGPGCPTTKKNTNQTEHGLGQEARRGTDRVERPYQCPAPGPREVRAPHRPGKGEGSADAAGARAHTHTKDMRGIPEWQPDRARGTHRPHGMAYQQARARDTRTGRPATHSPGHVGREGGDGEDTTPGTGPTPPNQPRAPRTHDQGTAPAKAVVAHRATHELQG